MPKCHICGKKLKGLVCSCGQEYELVDGILLRKNVYSRWLENLGKVKFKPKLNRDWGE